MLGKQSLAPDPEEDQISADSTLRKSIVMPILDQKGWKRGKLATEAGISPNSVYEYLDGKRHLSWENRKAIAEVLGLKPEQLPE